MSSWESGDSKFENRRDKREPGGSLQKMETWVIFVEHCNFPDTMVDT